MTPTPLFTGQVSEMGVLTLEQAETESRRRYLKSLAGQPVEVIIRRRRARRSLDQNAYLWGVAYPVLAEALGYDHHEHELLHYALLSECFGSVYDPRSGITAPARTSSQLTTKEFSNYMEWLVRWAVTEHGCRVPLPGEAEAA